jgi:hypothetical protein
VRLSRSVYCNVKHLIHITQFAIRGTCYSPTDSARWLSFADTVGNRKAEDSDDRCCRTVILAKTSQTSQECLDDRAMRKAASLGALAKTASRGKVRCSSARQKHGSTEMRRRGVTRAALPQLQEIMGCANSKRAAGAGNGCDSEEKWRSKTRRGIRGQRSECKFWKSPIRGMLSLLSMQMSVESGPSTAPTNRVLSLRLLLRRTPSPSYPSTSRILPTPVSCGHAPKPLSSSYLVLARKLLISESGGFQFSHGFRLRALFSPSIDSQGGDCYGRGSEKATALPCVAETDTRRRNGSKLPLPQPVVLL